MNILKIAFKNLNRQKRRSMLLLLAVAFAFLVVVFMDGMTAGALKSMNAEIAKVVGGHVYIIGAQKEADKDEDDEAQTYLDGQAVQTVERIVKESGIEAEYIIKRMRNEGKLIFEGKEASSQIDGCDFENEKLLHDSILFKEGSWEGMKKENALLLSETTAKALNAGLHDVVLYETETATGQLTVAELQIEGIAVDRSVFGSITNYINFEYAQNISQLPEDSLEVYALFLKNPEMQETAANHIAEKLAKSAEVIDRSLAKKTNPSNPGNYMFSQLSDGKWEGTKYAVISFFDFAPQMVTLMRTLQFVSFGVLAALLLITMIGISNTFKIIVHERKGEIGTMRSCGVGRGSIRALFIAEASFLSIIGAAAGFVLAIIIMQVFALIPIAKDSSFAVFTKNGHFTWILSFVPIAVKFLTVWVLTLLTVLGSASQAANMVPAEALRTGK
ncbi:FtsX-like permease family protein [Treponema sp. HNW]|uniref:ABC transporter permease n=1 Tax=Treponema sp. HNW TaxID=3116654 RepID=UPI003D0F13CE